MSTQERGLETQLGNPTRRVSIGKYTRELINAENGQREWQSPRTLILRNYTPDFLVETPILSRRPKTEIRSPYNHMNRQY
jgi:hypothetical protein